VGEKRQSNVYIRTEGAGGEIVDRLEDRRLWSTLRKGTKINILTT